MIPFVHSAKVPSPIHAGFRGMQQAKLSTKMIKTPKRGKLRSSGRVEVSERKHLTSREVERLIEATKGGRNEIRDWCLLLLIFRHGLHGHQPCTEVLAMNLKFPVVSQFEFPLFTARIRWRRRSRTSTCQNEVRA